MKFQYSNRQEDASFHLIIEEQTFEKSGWSEDDALLSLVWNRGPDQKVMIDQVEYLFPAQTVLPLVAQNTYAFDQTQDLVIWRFNRGFYCIIDHDEEVSCAGFLFYGSLDFMFIKLDDRHIKKLELLIAVFEDEFKEKDGIQGEMLRMLLKRLIIIVTRLGKQQYLPASTDLLESDLLRSYNLLVEKNFKKYHQVQDYASMLNRSPKTLSNLFAQYNHASPLQVIKNRIGIEAKRLLKYTDWSSKEIAFELGFDEPASFSRFFKNYAGYSPKKYREWAFQS